MLNFKFTLLAVLSYVAITGATPLGSRQAVKPIQVVRRQTEDCGVDPDPTCLCEADPSLSFCPQIPAPAPQVPNPSCIIDPSQPECQLNHAVRRQIDVRDCIDDPSKPICVRFCKINRNLSFCLQIPAPPPSVLNPSCITDPNPLECQLNQVVRRQPEDWLGDPTVLTSAEL